MNKNTWIAIATVIVVGLGAIYLSSGKNQQKTMTENQEQTGQMMEKDAKEMMGSEDKLTGKTETDAMMEKDKMMTGEKTAPSPTPSSIMEDKMMKNEVKGAYVTAKSSELPEIQKNYTKTVLFFHAAWCPFCKTANEAFLSRTSEIPNGVVVIKVDYDTEKDLKTKYGVTYQHTFVQIDTNGNQLAKWNGGDIDNLKSNIK